MRAVRPARWPTRQVPAGIARFLLPLLRMPLFSGSTNRPFDWAPRLHLVCHLSTRLAAFRPPKSFYSFVFFFVFHSRLASSGGRRECSSVSVCRSAVGLLVVCHSRSRKSIGSRFQEELSVRLWCDASILFFDEGEKAIVGHVMGRSLSPLAGRMASGKRCGRALASAYSPTESKIKKDHAH